MKNFFSKPVFVGLATPLVLGLCFSISISAAAVPATKSSTQSTQEIVTNEARFSRTPSWLTSAMVRKAVARIQRFLEWDIRRVEVIYHKDQEEFQKVHGLGPTVRAITYKQKNEIHLGPKVTAQNFEFVFGHELTHVILWQKFKDSIPKWLEEGLANFIPGADPAAQVDYSWLAKQNFPRVRDLGHPFGNFKGQDGGISNLRLEYQASSALAQMIASKCSIEDLISLSVGKSFESYLSTYCGIENLDDAFKKWVNRSQKKSISSEKEVPSQ